jgi:hypothetical protein
MYSFETESFLEEKPDLSSVDAWEAVKTSIGNKYNRYNKSATDSCCAANRIESSSFTYVHTYPKFKLSPESTFFVIGSCFSREIERVLEKYSFDFATKGFSIPLDFIDQDHKSLVKDLITPEKQYRIRSILNKYSPHTMLSELKRVLLNQQYIDNGLIEVVKDVWFDGQIKNLNAMNLDAALYVRQQVEGAIRKILDSQVIIINLGFTESWLDSKTGLVLNEAPYPLLLKNHPNRFKFFNSNYYQTVSALEELIELILAKTDYQMKFILTLSPIPLGTTFTNKDIILANTHSKSILRSAAQEICDKYSCVDYFPFYEMTVNSPYHLTWQENGLHPRYEMIEFCMLEFFKTYLQT